MRSRAATDDELMQAIALGDCPAFAELMRRHRGWVCQLLRAITHDRELAEDLTQETFTRVHRSAARYTARGAFPAWLRRVATNLARNHLSTRSRGATVPLSELEHELAQDARLEPMEAMLAKSVRADVRAAIDTLPDEQRLALVMRYFGDMSVTEIAWAMRCPEGTVKSRLHHALLRVRAVVTGTWSIEGEGRV